MVQALLGWLVGYMQCPSLTGILTLSTGAVVVVTRGGAGGCVHYYLGGGGQLRVTCRRLKEREPFSYSRPRVFSGGGAIGVFVVKGTYTGVGNINVGSTKTNLLPPTLRSKAWYLTA